MDRHTRSCHQNESPLSYDFHLMLPKVKLIVVHQMNYLKDQHE